MDTGGIDPLRAICDAAREAGAWVHVDGAFGMWAAASPTLRPLVDGIERADSWATDAHTHAVVKALEEEGTCWLGPNIAGQAGHEDLGV